MNVSFVVPKNIKYNSNKNKGRIISKIWDVKKKGGGVMMFTLTNVTFLGFSTIFNDMSYT